MEKRINFLDGFRGLAILLVICFHAYSRWPSIVPYGNRFASLILFKEGFLGVQLFFLISGFVILMTLEKSANFYNFIYKRWIRLFPAMLVATILVFVTAAYLPERPIGIPTLKNIIPGLIFIHPNLVEKITGINFGVLEGAFWSLFVEVKFYTIFGLLYFSLGTKKADLCLSGLYFTWFIITATKLKTYPSDKILEILDLCDINNFGWFASGAFAYLFYKLKTKSDLLSSILIGGISILIYHKDLYSMTFMSLLLAIFISTIYFEKLKNIVDNAFFLFFGFISYPLYLIHENAMIALIVKLGKHFSFIPQLLLPIMPIILLSIISYVIAKAIEPFVRKLIIDKLGLLYSRIKTPNDLPNR
jgi:peptidoglycan/LPS O-acetylase OafA/YrhL